MKRFLFYALFLCLSLGACAAGDRSTMHTSSNVSSGEGNAGIAGPPASNQKISFGVYDLSASSPFSIVTDAMRSDNNVEVSRALISAEPASETQPGRPLLSAVDPPHAQASLDTSPTDRKIIRNAELDLESDDPEDAQRRITAIAEMKGGFVVDSQQSSSDIQATSRDIVSMTVRVPAARFSETLSEIRGTASRVVVETVRGQDVTEEFIDIEAQLKAKKALEQQFMEIMKRSGSVEEALNVQRQLAEVRTEIERVEGRMRFLQNQSSLSTIKIRLQTAKVFAAASAGFGTRLVDAFASGFEVAMNFVLGLVTFIVAVLPFAILVCLPAFVIIRYFWRKQTGPRSVVELAEEELKIT